MQISGLTSSPITDGNSPWNEAFTFPTVGAWLAFQTLHPELFDKEVSPQDRAKRWKAFAQTREGKALRWR